MFSSSQAGVRTTRFSSTDTTAGARRTSVGFAEEYGKGLIPVSGLASLSDVEIIIEFHGWNRKHHPDLPEDKFTFLDIVKLIKSLTLKAGLQMDCNRQSYGNVRQMYARH